MSSAKPRERARVTTLVAVDPADAFEVFTQEIDAWWRRGPRFRFGGAEGGVLRFEGSPGGRLVEIFDDAPAFEIGRVLVWEPASRLVFQWRGRNFAPGEVTEVEVRFEAAPAGTRVTIEHRGWEAIPAKHPARHGLEGEALSSMIGLWWGELATSLRVYASRTRASPG